MLQRGLLTLGLQYLEILKRFTPDTSTADYRVFHEELDEAGACQQNGQPDWLEALSRHADGDRRTRAYNIRQAGAACEKLRNRPSSRTSDGVRIWNGPSADTVPRTSNSRTNGNSGLVMEQDFTTPGTPSKLHCPFMPPSGRQISSHAMSVYEKHSVPTPRSSMSRPSGQARRSKRPSFNDPIRAELCGNDSNNPISGAPSIEGSAPVCPIRFLDQHSPEEVAKYFEEHKHELPRSHEVCVKRFQSNAESIRQLDAKYGNLVSMIQGLGQKHQPWLPDKPELDGDEQEEGDHDRVDQWARAVSDSMHDGGGAGAGPAEEGGDERLPHFDRPLKEVRVGESPSRPWGISVPARFASAASASSEKSAETASPVGKPRVQDTRAHTQPAKCPFDHGALDKPAQAETQPSKPAPRQDGTSQTRHDAAPLPVKPQTNATPVVVTTPAVSAEAGEASTAVPQMVFTGPVFVGYPMEQALALLQQSGLGAKI